MSVAHEPVAMKIYVLAEEDLSALRSTWNPPRVYLSKQPGRTNMSGQIRETGWLGTTGHSHRLALGAVDTDTPDWSDRLRQLLPDDFQLDQAALLAWLQDDTVTAPFHLNPVHVRCTEGLTWNEESDEEDWWPSARPGWTIIATYGPEGAQVQIQAATELSNAVQGNRHAEPNRQEGRAFRTTRRRGSDLRRWL